ncbi:uncharacterized protein LOC120681668 [Panicum virgatum]|uniref:BED-type domain-containing protein n=1 Tax=Panicum virgatum TaxID=38727 RepID=A0A8T0PPZ1_PANVG|nr:uncharacterized protein LOC120681668 [Panicum virgatum]XP_039819187.1 uncharacterized protein LOC120681668 [Panicum virgatum]XP_039819188.1 uncharacterized protein LOC120681668 [Panicum virgatum]XP_039819189.1 uncharacterized protein LOC120681668 [Panicum virgatum]XP_039819190.1 uncharacterized protein LOC120681668 [Panicum virgatum]XP_039819191.1 uncharacterized protein LOC120681668 [Panicum virgatum]KAG2564437.1 hypothetical protein PVAP13_7NG112414 [Panicum virgatum]
MASPTSANGEYDPKIDPARKPPRSTDPGWKYAYWPDLENKDKVECLLCGDHFRGGIKRLKQHLAGGYGDAKLCPKSTSELRKEMTAYIESNKRKRPIYLGEEEEEVVEVAANGSAAVHENEASVVESQASKVQPKPSSGTAAKRRQATLQFKASDNKKKPQTKAPKSVVEMMRKTPEEMVDERLAESYQPTIVSITKSKEEKEYVDMQWALFFYECGIPFNAAASRQFHIAVEATAQYGSGYKPVTPYQLGEPLLQKDVKATSTMREDHERAWKHYGCTLMSDGWSDKRGRHLINFLVNSPEGTYFLESIDASSEVHDANMLADLLEEKIEGIGRDNVVQVVTDNGANFKAAGKLLMERIPTMFWSPCAAHYLDLMLEDIGNLKEFKKPIARARRVTTFIYRHGRVLSAMREKTGGAGIVRAAATRFATSFLTLKSMYKHKDELKSLFVSPVWTGNKLAKTKAGLDVHDIILSTQFWNSVEDCLRASAPLLIVLRVVDGDERPAMPEVQALMKHAKEKITQSFAIQTKKSLLKSIMAIIERRWEKQMDHPLYGAAMYLNPGKLHPLIRDDDDATVGQLRGCFLDVLARMVEDEDTRDKINAQAMDYEYLRGNAFSNKMAKDNIATMSPLEWWRSYGDRAIELQRFARRLVSLCASSSGCERNWSTFEFIHTKKRNRFLHKRLNSIVFVSYNRKMKARFQKLRHKKGKNFDPLVVEDFSWDNEWADSLHVAPEGARGCECDLTWDLVDNAVGASQSLRGRKLPRRAHNVYSRRNSPHIVEGELGSENEEEENEDPHDDADVTDSEEPNGANNGGEQVEAATNIPGEFDDGY